MLPPALLLVDIQNGLDDWAYYGGNRNNLDAEKNASLLLEHWRSTHRPVIHVKHNSVHPDSPLRTGQPGNEIKSIVAPASNEPIFEKRVNSAFIGTELESYLHHHSIKGLVIAGLTTDHCISTTVRMAGNLGFETFVAEDGTATFDKKTFDGEILPSTLVHKVTLASLHWEFASVMTTKELITKWGRLKVAPSL